MDKVTTEIIWAAGLFVGEGCFGVMYRGQRVYMHTQLSMCDARAIERFARSFDTIIMSSGYAPLKVYDRGVTSIGRPVFQVNAAGTRAQIIADIMEPYIEGTDKFDQLQIAKGKLTPNRGRNYKRSMTPNVRLSKEEKDLILLLQAEKLSQQKIAEKLNRSRGTIWSFLKRSRNEQ